jgi:EAL domain-containing protein (putative c-di-GMP-specific phosphodiesterase class I)
MRSISPVHPQTLLSQLGTVLLGTVVLAGLATVARLASLPGGVWPLYWPVAGVGFAMLCTQGKSAAWSIALGAGLWVGIAAPQHWVLIPVAMVSAVAGPWLVWRRLQVRFASTSQPFARQVTMMAFIKDQTFIGTPLSAALATAGLLITGTVPPNAIAAQTFLALWITQLCGTLLFTPLAWEMLISRTRTGLPRFFGKLGESVRADRRTVSGLLLVALAVGELWWFGQVTVALAVLLMLVPLLAFDATRAAPSTAHLMALLSGVAVLTAASQSAGRAQAAATQTSLELMLATVAVTVGVCAVQLLLVTAHERRLALKRLERQADTDPLTNLLSLTGLYRKIEELGERTEDAGDTQFGGTASDGVWRPALISVQMTNADSMEQLLGSRQSDVIERTTSGALTSAAPKVQWARISKAHFVGLLVEPTSSLDGLLSRVNFAAVESRSLVESNVGRPLWTVAAVTLDADTPPPVEVVMACLRRTEQAAQESRQTQIAAVNRESAQALKLEAEQAEKIRQIIQQKKLVLYAQPIVANVNPESLPHKYEVLIRLQDEQGQIISPGVFLPVAMRAGMMQLLDMAVMEQTFEWFAAHPKALDALSHCAINLSGPTVASPVVAQRIAEGLKQHNLPAHKFTFEITESQAIANPAQATDTIRAIRDCGCRVAIDDFGTGVATFDYLKRFDVDYIKIDGAFVKSLLEDPVDRVIVESIVKVAHQLGVRTVAEFVSSAELHGAVTALGVDESQGYAFGAPQPLHTWFDEAA